MFLMWLACHNRLATKFCLAKFGVIIDRNCVFCNAEETMQHLVFECSHTKQVWEKVLGWLNIKHGAQGWNQEVIWLVKVCRSKNWRRHFVQIVVAETAYAVWLNRNDIVFNNGNINSNIVESIIEKIVNRVWMDPKYRNRVAQMLMS